jgi:hypothetical protein
VTVAGPRVLGDPSLRDDLLIRLQRRVGLAPADGLGVVRRAVVWGLVGWLPIAVWAMATGHAFAPGGESLLQHYGVTVRSLIAVPLMVIAEAVLAGTVRETAPWLIRSHLIDPDHPRLGEALHRSARLRDRAHPWAMLAGAVLGLFAGALHGLPGYGAGPHAIAWAGEAGPGSFGALWFVWVARPMYIACAVSWLWRVVVMIVAIRSLRSVGLRLLPAHPDRMGGLGVLQGLPLAFGVVAFALSSVVAAGWAHDVLWHGVDARTLAAPMGAALVVLVAVFLGPLLVLGGAMRRARLRARFQYAALLGRHADALHRKWIDGEPVRDDVLEAPEIGAAADAATLYEAVSRMRTVPVSLAMLAMVAVPAALPMLVVLALQVPLAPLLLAVLKALL